MIDFYSAYYSILSEQNRQDNTIFCGTSVGKVPMLPFLTCMKFQKFHQSKGNVAHGNSSPLPCMEKIMTASQLTLSAAEMSRKLPWGKALARLSVPVPWFCIPINQDAMLAIEIPLGLWAHFVAMLALFLSTAIFIQGHNYNFLKPSLCYLWPKQLHFMCDTLHSQSKRVF